MARSAALYGLGVATSADDLDAIRSTSAYWAGIWVSRVLVAVGWPFAILAVLTILGVLKSVPMPVLVGLWVIFLVVVIVQRVLFNRAGIPVRSLLPLSDDHLVRQKIRSDTLRGRRADTGAEGATAR